MFTHDTAGTTILLFFNLPERIKEYIAAKLADDPELTNTEYLVPNHLDHFFSNSIVRSPLVNLGLVFNHSINFGAKS